MGESGCPRRTAQRGIMTYVWVSLGNAMKAKQAKQLASYKLSVTCMLSLPMAAPTYVSEAKGKGEGTAARRASPASSVARFEAEEMLAKAAMPVSDTSR